MFKNIRLLGKKAFSTKMFHFNSIKFFCNKLSNDSFINGNTGDYIEKMYELWKKDNNSVHCSWDIYFSNLDKGLNYSSAYQSPPTIDKGFSPSKFNLPSKFQLEQRINSCLSSQQQFVPPITPQTLANTTSPVIDSNIEDSMKVNLLVRAFQSNGYLAADIDPIKLETIEEKKKRFKEYNSIDTLDYRNYGFSEADLDREFLIKTEQISGILAENRPLKLREIIDRLKKAYCSTIGIEFMYVISREECNFLREKIECGWYNYKPSKEHKLMVYDRLMWAVLFEEFLKSKFTTHTRFGLEGLETMVSGLRSYVDKAVELGLKDITLGMAHRGRLNVLANVFKKPISKMFAEFQENHGDNKDKGKETELITIGDVKYHLGTHFQRSYEDGKVIHMDILPNPSHLECVNPVVMGKTRAKQHFSGDYQRKENLAILIHGDAGFAGQGVVYESMQMTNLKNFTTGGVLHVICNNQIGFTTDPNDCRNTPFCTNIGKSLESPIIHVNADDPLAVDFAFITAAEYSKKFGKDILIDVIGYRKYGHNELDQPMFTQPLMYKKIAQKENILKMYEDKLIAEGVASKETFESMKKRVRELMDEYYQDAINNKIKSSDWVPLQWENFSVKKYSDPIETGIPLQRLKFLGEKITNIPPEFNAHPQIRKIYEKRAESIRSGKNIDWATAEALAWADLLESGHTVRLTGEDSERGSFSHRHAILHDQNDDSRYIPLQQVANQKENFQVHNSHLSEFAVLGYELGFSYYSPDALVMWEAQYGDFINGAQIIVDQFISSGEKKWSVPSGIVLLLPHGMDGHGPDHSTCKLERFLSLMDDDPRVIPDLNSDRILQIQNTNMQVCNPTFAANYFHVLMRQIKRHFRKPLIIPSPKKLLKFKPANSNIDEFAMGLRFTKVRNEIDQNISKNSKNVKKLLICQGQVYYDLLSRRELLGRKDVAIITLEQIAPFPYNEVLENIKFYSNAEIFWVQEEHLNQGCWAYVEPRLRNLLRKTGMSNRSEITYIGRNVCAASSAGYLHLHEKELEQFLTEAFK